MGEGKERRSERVGKYLVERELGRGGMSVVWAARDTVLERDVALKLIATDDAKDPRRKRRLLREAKSLARLDHPGVARVLDFGEIDETVFLAMEIVSGDLLSERIKREDLDVKDVGDIASSLAEALAAAHEAKIVHRDLKPSNIMLTPENRPVLLDFGIARLLDEDSLADRTTTADGQVIGTPAYMSPEQVRGLVVDSRSDVFSFGCLLYELVSGKRPFERNSNADSIMALLTEEPPPLSRDTPPKLLAIISRCLAKDATERYADGSELHAAFLTREISSPQRRWPLALGVVLLAGGAFGVSQSSTLFSCNDGPAAHTANRIEELKALLKTIPETEEQVFAAAASPSGLLAVSRGGALSVFSADNPDGRGIEWPAPVGALSFDEDDLLIVGHGSSSSATVSTLDLASSERNELWDLPTEEQPKATESWLAETGRSFAFRTGGTLGVFSQDAGVRVIRKVGAETSIRNATMSGSGQRVAWFEFGAESGTLFVADAQGTTIERVAEGLRRDQAVNTFLIFSGEDSIVFGDLQKGRLVRASLSRSSEPALSLTGVAYESNLKALDAVNETHFLTEETRPRNGAFYASLGDSAVKRIESPQPLSDVDAVILAWTDAGPLVYRPGNLRPQRLDSNGTLLPTDFPKNTVPVGYTDGRLSYITRIAKDEKATLFEYHDGKSLERWTGTLFKDDAVACSAAGCVRFVVDLDRNQTTVGWITGESAGDEITTISTPHHSMVADSAVDWQGELIAVPQNTDGVLLVATKDGSTRRVQREGLNFQHIAYDGQRDRFIIAGMQHGPEPYRLFRLSRSGDVEVIATLGGWASGLVVSPRRLQGWLLNA